MSKSLRLLSVSAHPPFLRTAPLVVVKAGVDAPPSALFAVPHATRSMICALGRVHGVAVAPHVFGASPFTSATLPFVPDMLRLVVLASGVGVIALHLLPEMFAHQRVGVQFISGTDFSLNPRLRKSWFNFAPYSRGFQTFYQNRSFTC